MATEAALPSGPPAITKDPRFVAGRTLVQSGQAKNGGIEIFATLVEETTVAHGNASLETATCYYEYGNALFRAMTASSEVEEGEAEEKQEDSKKAAVAAEAAEKRLKEGPPSVNKSDASGSIDDEKDLKPAAKAEPQDSSPGNKENQEQDDITLALEMMENAWSIMDKIAAESSPHDWIDTQLPRILIGLGDVLLEMERFGDAVDVYTRALPYREASLQQLIDTKKEPTIELLRARRQLAETNVLVAETILACPEGRDIVTTETKDTLVEAAERENYAQGYYDKAREDLQETVLCLGRVATKNDTEEFKREKENVCFLATMLMGVGEQLAAIGEKKEDSKMNSKLPAKKKAKR